MIEKLSDIQNELKMGKSIPLLDNDTIEYLQKPIGKAIYKKSIDNVEKKKYDPYEKMECKICGNIYTRSHRSSHNKTKLHQAYFKMNKNLSSLLLK